MTNEPGSTAATASVSLQGDTAQVTGPLNFATVPSVLPQSAQWLGRGLSDLTVDLTGVPWADSAGLALLLEWLVQARGKGLSIHYAGIDRQVAEIIRINGLQELIGNNSPS